MHIDTMNRLIDNERVILSGVPRDEEPSICYKCANTGEIWAEKEDCQEFITFHAIRHGWKVALSVWHDWKHNHTIPCPECQY